MTATCGDLFGGCGGAAEGFRQAGMHGVWSIELDPFAAAAYRINHPNTTVLEADVSQYDPASLPRVGHLHASPPCQDFSVARRSTPSQGREALYGQVIRYVRVLRPTSVSVENVPGSDHAAMELCYQLGTLGYHAAMLLLNAADFGVAQTRKRVWVVAGKDAVPTIEPTHYDGDTGMIWVDLRQPWASAWSVLADILQAMPYRALPPWCVAGFARHDPSFPELVAPASCLPVAPSPEVWQTGVLFSGGNTHGSKRAPSYRPLMQPAFTVMAGHETTPYACVVTPDGHYSGKVGSRAKARLQGFADSYQFTGSTSRQSRQIGNAVPPPVSRAIGLAVQRTGCLDMRWEAAG